MLYTNLKHIENAEEYTRIIHENENVLIVCGRMDPFCIPVYRMAEELEKEYSNVNFYDMEFDNPKLAVILTLPEVTNLPGNPIVLYYKNEYLVKASSELQTKVQIRAILDHEFKSGLKV